MTRQSTIVAGVSVGQRVCPLPKQLGVQSGCSVPEQLWSPLGEGENELIQNGVASNLHFQLRDKKLTMPKCAQYRKLQESQFAR